MAKKLFLASDIDVAQNAVFLDGNIPIERLLLITNVTAGAGKIIYMADDPIFRNFWEGGKLILTNAVFFHGK
jgi:hypothetical protein